MDRTLSLAAMFDWIMASVLTAVALGVVVFYAISVRRHERLLEERRRDQS
ncbi:MAG: hypothetical protein ACFE0P_00590 [Oceanicaulis sp.]